MNLILIIVIIYIRHFYSPYVMILPIYVITNGGIFQSVILKVIVCSQLNGYCSRVCNPRTVTLGRNSCTRRLNLLCRPETEQLVRGSGGVNSNNQTVTIHVTVTGLQPANFNYFLQLSRHYHLFCLQQFRLCCYSAQGDFQVP